VADSPDDGSENHREKETEERPRDCDDDLIERRNGRELGPIRLGLALDDIHRRELRKGNKAAERDRA
jgi:hypothetical protein